MEKNRVAENALVFLKFVGDKFENCRADLMKQYSDTSAFLEKVSIYNVENVFYLKEAMCCKTDGGDDKTVQWVVYDLAAVLRRMFVQSLKFVDRHNGN